MMAYDVYLHRYHMTVKDNLPQHFTLWTNLHLLQTNKMEVHCMRQVTSISDLISISYIFAYSIELRSLFH